MPLGPLPGKPPWAPSRRASWAPSRHAFRAAFLHVSSTSWASSAWRFLKYRPCTSNSCRDFSAYVCRICASIFHSPAASLRSTPLRILLAQYNANGRLALGTLPLTIACCSAVRGCAGEAVLCFGVLRGRGHASAGAIGFSALAWCGEYDAIDASLGKPAIDCHVGWDCCMGWAGVGWLCGMGWSGWGHAAAETTRRLTWRISG